MIEDQPEDAVVAPPCAECGWVYTTATPLHYCDPPKPRKKPRRKASKLTPQKRTLDYCKARGWSCESTEHWNPFAGVRQDLFDFCDVFAVGEIDKGLAAAAWTASGLRPLMIQATSDEKAGHSKRRQRKIEELPAAALLVQAGVIVEVWAWKKTKRPMGRAPGGGQKVWAVKRTRARVEGGRIVEWIEVPNG